MALRLWKPFLGAFPHIDTAIEAADADGLLSRDDIRIARSRIVEMLCDAADNDDEKAEGFCVLLDEAMAASLATLRAVPSERIALASDDLVGAVGALMRDHASERVRGPARDVVRGWRAGVKAKLARARAAMDVLDGLSSTPPPPHQDSDTKAKKIPEKQPRPRKTAVVSSCRISTAESKKIPEEEPCPRKTAIVSSCRISTAESKKHPEEEPCPRKTAVVSSCRVSTADSKKIPEEQPRPRKTAVVSSCRVSTAESYGPLPKNRAPVVRTSNVKPSSANTGAPAVVPVPAQPKMTPPVVACSVAVEKKMEATKRKLHEEAEDAKRQRTIEVIRPATNGAKAAQRAPRREGACAGRRAARSQGF